MFLVGEEAVKIEQSGSFTWDNPERPTLTESVTNHSLTHSLTHSFIYISLLQC